MPLDRRVTMAPIKTTDVGRVSNFLHKNLNRRVPATAWADAMNHVWVKAPNHGFMLRDGDTVVGVYLAFYSEREICGKAEPICNLGAWCVLDEYRSHGLRLVRAMLAQREYTFTDLSPSGNVVPLNQRLRFKSLDTATAAMPNLPWLKQIKGMRITSSLDEIRGTLTGQDLHIFVDHVDAAAALHILLVDVDQTCHVILRRDRRKRLPIFGSILYVSNPKLFRLAARQVAWHLLRQHKVLVTLAELRVVGGRLPGSLMLRRPRPKMVKSSHIKPDQVDYLYSELTSIAW